MCQNIQLSLQHFPVCCAHGWIDADSAKYCNDDDTCVRVRGRRREGVGWLSQGDEDEM